MNPFSFFLLDFFHCLFERILTILPTLIFVNSYLIKHIWILKTYQAGKDIKPSKTSFLKVIRTKNLTESVDVKKVSKYYTGKLRS